MALQGKAMDPNAGSWTIDPVFDGSAFKFGYLVRAMEEAPASPEQQNAAWRLRAGRAGAAGSNSLLTVALCPAVRAAQMKPNPFLDMGITVGKINAADQLKGNEELIVAA